MTKEEKIKEAYRLVWNIMPEKSKNDALNYFGYICTDDFYLISNGFTFSQIETKEKTLLYNFHRPKSLQGIENNNGWIKIKSEDDLKLNRGNYFFRWLEADGKERIEIRKVTERGIDCYQVPTHYQPIEKPKLPIY